MKLSKSLDCGKYIFDLDLKKILAAKFRSLLTLQIKLVPIKNIDIFPIYWPKSIIFSPYAQIWAYSILLISNFDKTYIHVFRRLVATNNGFTFSHGP